MAKMAVVDYRLCDPACCPDGICPATRACDQKVLKQEGPFETPMPGSSPCRACGECVRVCPLGAIKLVTG